mgnify:CR=1 FL=1
MVKKEFVLHIGTLFVFIVSVIVFKRWFDLAYWPFLVGGILGTILPDIDHLIYVYFVSPQDLTSQRVSYLVYRREILRSISLLYETRSERKSLIFHSTIFQIIFWILCFLVITSSGSIFGRGLVLAFSLHIVVDQAIDFKFQNLKPTPYFYLNVLILLFFGILL